MAHRAKAIVTPRQREALDLLCQGLKVDEIAEKMGVTHDTAESCLGDARRRLGAMTRPHAAALWTRRKPADVDETAKLITEIERLRGELDKTVPLRAALYDIKTVVDEHKPHGGICHNVDIHGRLLRLLEKAGYGGDPRHDIPEPLGGGQ